MPADDGDPGPLLQYPQHSPLAELEPALPALRQIVVERRGPAPPRRASGRPVAPDSIRNSRPSGPPVLSSHLLLPVGLESAIWHDLEDQAAASDDHRGSPKITVTR